MAKQGRIVSEEVDQITKTKTINLGNDQVSIAWTDDDVHTIFYRPFRDSRRALSWLSENVKEVNPDDVKIKRSGLYSVKYKWKLVNHKTGNIALDNRQSNISVAEPKKTLLYVPKKEKEYVYYLGQDGLVYRKECTEETRKTVEKTVIAGGATEIRYDDHAKKVYVCTR